MYSKKGVENHFYGRHHSEKTKNRISKSRKGKNLGNKNAQGNIPWNKNTKGIMKAWNKGKKLPNQSGEKHPKWKGGISRIYKTGYYSLEYKNWRRKVFERDDFTCRECGATGYVTAHHIKSFALYKNLRYELSNGLTLCEGCHSKTDNYKGRANKKVR